MGNRALLPDNLFIIGHETKGKNKMTIEQITAYIKEALHYCFARTKTVNFKLTIKIFSITQCVTTIAVTENKFQSLPLLID